MVRRCIANHGEITQKLIMMMFYWHVLILSDEWSWVEEERSKINGN